MTTLGVACGSIVLAMPLVTLVAPQDAVGLSKPPTLVREVLRQRLREYSHAQRRVREATRRGEAPSASDSRWVTKGAAAIVAGDVYYVVTVDPLEGPKESQAHHAVQQLRQEWVSTATAAAERVISEFNRAGGEARYVAGDPEFLESFALAVIAASRVGFVAPDSGQVPVSAAEAGATAAERILSEFNENGPSASYHSRDVEALSQLDRLLDRLERRR